jgi:hypothetical protein
MKRKATTSVPVFQRMLSSRQLSMPSSPFRSRGIKFLRCVVRSRQSSSSDRTASVLAGRRGVAQGRTSRAIGLRSSSGLSGRSSIKARGRDEHNCGGYKRSSANPYRWVVCGSCGKIVGTRAYVLTYGNHPIDPIEAFDNHCHPSGVPSMAALIVGIFAAIIVGATAAFSYVLYADHSGRNGA